ncbi:hypothetical protein L7F22_035415 [Adiantum nelumboides]|nr:hypothetical protein [Adiantum nelumboides]
MELNESGGVKVLDLALRAIAALLTLLSLSLLLAASRSFPSGLTFAAFRPFEYLFVVSALVLIHSGIQGGVSAWYYMRKRSITNHACYYPYFRLGKDMVCALLLLSASSAVLGATTLNTYFHGSKYIKQANGAAALSLFAFLCVANSSTISFYRLPCH